MKKLINEYKTSKNSDEDFFQWFLVRKWKKTATSVFLFSFLLSAFCMFIFSNLIFCVYFFGGVLLFALISSIAEIVGIIKETCNS